MKFIYAPLVNLNNPASAVATMNANWLAAQTAIENTLSRDGTSPNAMGSQLDMNGNRILNLPAPSSLTDPVRLADLTGVFTPSSSFVSLSSYASLQAAVTAIGSAKLNLLVDTSQTVAANTTVPSNITLGFMPNTPLIVADGITLTVNGAILAGDNQQIFSLAGTGVAIIATDICPVGWYGVLTSNADNYTNMMGMLNSFHAGKGGTCLFNTGSYIFASNIVLPRTSGTEPTMKPLIFRGSGFHSMGRGDAAPVGGTILEFTSNLGLAHITCYGTGGFLIEDLNLLISQNTALPFIFTTYTTLKCNRVLFAGFNYGSGANNDAVVFGGTTDVQDGSLPNAPFQGYGSCISNCAGHRIRRLAYGRIFANAIVIKDNWLWATCGSLNGGAIELDGTGDVGIADFNEGWVVTGNQVEIHQYKYFAVLKSAPWNTFIGNHIYDLSGITVADFYLQDASCFRNVFIGGVKTDPDLPFVSDAGPNVLNTIIPGNLNGTYRYSEAGPTKFNEGVFPLTQGGSTVGDINLGFSELWLNDPVGSTPVVNFQSGQGQIAWSFGNMFYGGASVGSHFFNQQFGYALGSGGSVTQITNKATAVTLNKVCGAVVTNNASLAAGTTVSFTLNNSFIAATDVPMMVIGAGATANSYVLTVTAVAAGSCRIELHNTSGGALAEAITIRFTLQKAWDS